MKHPPDRVRAAAIETRRAFLARVGTDLGLYALDQLPDVYFFVKDHAGRFMHCNRACLSLQGFHHLHQAIGKTDGDVSFAHLVPQYVRDDREVLATGKPIVDKIELVRNRDGSVGWFSTTKFVVRNRVGAVIGVAGITRDLGKMNAASGRFLSLAPAIELIMNNHGGPIRLAALAKAVALSVSQFRRQFKQRFATTPLEYIRQVRINAACELLITSDLPLAEIASSTGFCDQSHFSNEFVRRHKITPRRYRARFGLADSG